jgi:hypothetical protein
MAYTPEQGARILHKLADLLTDQGEQAKLRRDYAFQVRKGAVSLAFGRPTPQARMAASGLRVKGGSVLGFPGTRVNSGGRSIRLGGVSFGAEYGSNTHSQFGPRRESGYFLNPAAERVNDAVGDDWIDDIFNAAFTRFG